MASIQREFQVGASAGDAWAALRDFGAVHERVAPGFVTDTRLANGDRIVTFASGAVARERLVAADDEHRRLVYSVVDGSRELVHHQSSVEVLDSADGAPGCRLVWITDVLPDEAAPFIEALMDQGVAAIARGLAK